MSKEFDYALTICRVIQEAGFEAVFVGGCVRDSLAKKDYNDIDIATSAPSERTSRLLSDIGYEVKKVGESFEVILARKAGFEFEVAAFRKDIGCDGRHPAEIKMATMEEDAARRDFTINSIFFDPIKNIYYDFNDGASDIENKKLKFVGNTEERCKEDYLRILRFMRFWSRGYIPSDADIKKVDSLCCNISLYVSPDRISKEFMEKILPSENIKELFVLQDKVPNLFWNLFPEVSVLKGTKQNPKYHPEGNAYIHTMMVVNNLIDLNANPLLILAGLFHDIGKANATTEVLGEITSNGHEKVSETLTKKIMKKYRFSNEDTEYVSGLVGDHMKLHYSGMRVSTLRKLMAMPYFDDLLKLVKADIMSSNKDFVVYEDYMKEIKELEETTTRKLPKPFVSGDTLIIMGLNPGPDFKKILEAAMDEQLEGRINSEEEGILFVRSFLPRL